MSVRRMKVTAIKQQLKNSERVSVFVDGKYSFSLTLTQLLDAKLKKDTELEESDIKLFKRMSEEGKLKLRVLEWLMRRPHSERELRDYLFRKRTDKHLVESWVEDFKRSGYLDDAAFGKWLAESRSRKNKSSRAITTELASKGLAKDMIARILKDLRLDNSESDGTALRALIDKLRGKSRYADEDRLKRYLLSKGFSYSQIIETLRARPERE